ncbi:oxidoreductase [Ramlibacter sp. USB13]|uniref:Oxidoreductase n=1 Tax=Ramlibacter cellulosilyticus TaxID=2764187 RepID=A0A923MLI5_9BURK|nr:PDR/VanB family oxidoreductase [Ramlibacter cellulosilyticus]MBC5781358.1 oxidoreductase [Ramlibacter cellulosilyticus]
MQTAAPVPLRIHAITHAAEGVLLFELRRPQAGELPAFTPGAHVDVHLAPGLVRSYSLVNSANERHRYVIGVKRDPASRGGSAWLHEQARAGQVIEVGAPRNNFALQEDAPCSVLLAGGIGITPLWSMVQRLEERGRPWELHYGNASRASAALLEELQAPHRAGRVHLSFADEGGERLDIEGIVREAPAGAHFYCCGPAGMLQAFQAACRDIDPARVHFEAFGPAEASARSGGFVVHLARSGRSVQVPAGQTILETLEACGIDVPYSCREGVCGACETRVLRGTPEHRDMLLSEAERAAGRTMMVCCSGSVGPELELDL